MSADTQASKRNEPYGTRVIYVSAFVGPLAADSRLRDYKTRAT